MKKWLRRFVFEKDLETQNDSAIVVNGGEYFLSGEVKIHATFTDTKVTNCFNTSDRKS